MEWTEYYESKLDSEERRLIDMRYDLTMTSEQALAMEFIAFRREILEYGFKATSAYDGMEEYAQELYEELLTK